ncbi:effector binding domain-containing protein [Paenibacillus motobuensis]|uniref:GyrI-like domain-containing protein n=1 Tax=Paenibacillus TaxID=44249 RepID=UPI00203CFBFF|nr:MULTISPECIES: effector binding domain-containing protein [Paenibacillus]MCM3042698.1 effector binding domain-containing protein [Paenibacillus lutimineralis]MCM3649802.1 effector binding domain-containing protein [Paenibacillus motobuensis]
MELYILESTRTNNFKDPDMYSKITGIWQNIQGRPEVANTVIYGVYHNYESNYKGDYDLSIATSSFTTTKKLTVAEQGYKIFKVDRSKENGVFETWQRIWALEESGELDRAYTFDYEKYDVNGQIEIFIAVI